MQRSGWWVLASSLLSSSRRKCFFFVLVWIVFGVGAFTPAGRAQTASTGALTGVVTDATGGTITGASLRVTSQATGEVRTVVTGANGIYFVAALPPGPYTLKVSRDGIRRKYSDSDIELILGGNFKRAHTAIWTLTAEK